MSIYPMSIMGSSALGAVIWGQIAERSSAPTSLVIAAASTFVFLGFTRHRRLEDPGDDHLTPTRPYQEPVPARAMDPQDGPVMVTIEYRIDPAHTLEFEALMADSRSARLRQGAVSWGLFEDLHEAGRFVEYFACDSWADYLRRFDRFTAGDERLQAQRYAFHLGDEPPLVSRYIARHPPAR